MSARDLDSAAAAADRSQAGSKRVHLRIRGHVQGVSFRYYARRQGQGLGLSGWVRNCPDGTVEAVAEGDSGAVDRFVDWARHGPPGAYVDGIDEEYLAPEGSESRFRIAG